MFFDAAQNACHDLPLGVTHQQAVKVSTEVPELHGDQGLPSLKLQKRPASIFAVTAQLFKRDWNSQGTVAQPSTTQNPSPHNL